MMHAMQTIVKDDRRWLTKTKAGETHQNERTEPTSSTIFFKRRSISPVMTLLAALIGVVCAGSAWADGMIVIPRPTPTTPAAFPLSVKYHRVDAAIQNGIAKTSVDQEFYNPTGARLEGTYIFPLPAGAVLSNFAMEIDGKMVEAELLDAAKARKIYEDIVRQMRDPALLEYLGNGAFKARIFPIEPHSGKRVRLSYSEVLKSDSGLYAYTYPLNTEKFSSSPLDDLSIRVSLETPTSLKTILCPTHEVETKRKGDRSALVGFEAKRVKPDQDFVLYFGAAEKSVGLSVLSNRAPGSDGYFLLTAAPAYDSGTKVVGKDVTFVLDVSGSMAGDKMSQARRALLFCLSNLNADDRFDIIRFSTEADSLFSSLVPTNGANLEKAKKYVNDLKPIGGTNVEDALTMAIKENASSDSRPKVVIFVTDGRPTIGETEEDPLLKKVIKANVHQLRIFTFGIGSDLNTHLLDKLTDATKSYRTYVSDKEDIELKISSFFEKIKSPVLVDLKLKFGNGIKVYQTYPRDLPDLFRGSQLTVFGRYSGSGSGVTLEGTVDGKPVKLDFPAANFPEKNESNSFIAQLWAAQRVGYLLDQIRLHGQEKELVDEVTELARHFGIITPYTSYLIVEDERAKVAQRNLAADHLTLGGNAMANEVLAPALKKEYGAMRAKSGAPSVTASSEVEGLKGAVNYAQVAQGSSRLEYKDKEGRVQNLAQQAKNISGRAVYQVGNQWVDSKVQTMKNSKALRIQFASKEYFDLIVKEPQAAQFLALGRNVRFALNQQIYEIYE